MSGMGYMRHHAILVTTQHADTLLEQAHAKAEELGMTVTPMVDSAVNHVRTFVVLPDGSKEGWRASDEGDAARDELIRWMRQQHYSDGSSPLQYAEVQYADEDGHNQVLRTDDDVWRAAQGI